jgi:hypothetical protein
MKGGNEIYPNKGVKIDPRALTSARMPESLKVYSGYLIESYRCLMGEGILKQSDINKEDKKIRGLLPFYQTGDKLKSSYWFRTDYHLVEFLRTSNYNYKVYALKIFFLEEVTSLFQL